MTQASSDRSPSRSPSPSLSSTPASLADTDGLGPQPPHGIDLASLRRRVRAASFSSTSNSPPPSKDDTMFNRNRYQQLPTNTNGQRRRAGGLTAWKRYTLIAVAGAFIVFTAFTLFGPISSDDSVAYEETREYSQQLRDSRSLADIRNLHPQP